MMKYHQPNINKVETACKKHGHESEHMFQRFNFIECAAYLKYKCCKNDIAISKLVSKRRNQCIEVMQCESLISSPHASDDDGACDPIPDPNVIDVLMDLSSSTMDIGIYEYAL